MKIKLSNSKELAIIDDDCFDVVEKYRWRLFKNDRVSYVVTGSGGRLIFMHRLLANPPQDRVVDHINGDGLDNRKDNLRVCTNKENIRNRSINKNNTSGYKGVYRHGKNWNVQIKVDGKKMSGGHFSDIGVAAEKYNRLAREYFGEFAKLNNI